MAAGVAHTLPREYDATLSNQGNFRFEVPIERLFTHILISSPVKGVIPQILDHATAWKYRAFAVLSLGESLGKTVLTALAVVVTTIAHRVFGSELDHEVYEDALQAHFASFWLSALMIGSPQTALNTAMTPISDEDPTIDRVNIGREAEGVAAIAGHWGTVGDVAQATWEQILGIVGPITP